MSDLKSKIQQAVNSVSAENGSDTPDFILAEYICDCLNAFDKAVASREKWYGGRPDKEETKLSQVIHKYSGTLTEKEPAATQETEVCRRCKGAGYLRVFGGANPLPDCRVCNGTGRTCIRKPQGKSTQEDP